MGVAKFKREFFMYQVMDFYQRFDQKNNLIYRPDWDASLRELAPLKWETQLRHIRHKVAGFEWKDFSLAASAQLLVSSLGTSVNTPNSGLKAWDPFPVSASFKFPEEKPAISGGGGITSAIKRVARYFGANLVGIAKLDMRWVYSHHYIPSSYESKPVQIDEQYKYVIAMAVEEDYEMIKTAPTALYYAEVLLTYSRMAFLVGALAQFIRQYGYRAIPSLNDTALNIPIAVDAGLGEVGRHGVLITPQFGPRIRLCKVITDLPLSDDKPINLGVTQFCTVCRKCAKGCPSQAISYGEPTAEYSSISTNPGVIKWAVQGEKCWEYRLKHFATTCGICVRVCPFNKNKNRLHEATRFLIKNASWIDPILIWLDDRLGYGQTLDPDEFWNS